MNKSLRMLAMISAGLMCGLAAAQVAPPSTELSGFVAKTDTPPPNIGFSHVYTNTNALNSQQPAATIDLGRSPPHTAMKFDSGGAGMEKVITIKVDGVNDTSGAVVLVKKGGAGAASPLLVSRDWNYGNDKMIFHDGGQSATTSSLAIAALKYKSAPPTGGLAMMNFGTKHVPPGMTERPGGGSSDISKS